MHFLKPKTDFWSGKRVFLTGHTGFKGSWLSLWLSKKGANLTGFALESECDQGNDDQLGYLEKIVDLRGDIRDAETLKRAMKKQKPDIVIHMAAQSLVRHSYFNPMDTFQTNVIGTVNLLEAIRSVETVRVALIITSDKCYKNNNDATPISENAPFGGDDPYSASKACTELVVNAYAKSFFNGNGNNHSGTALACARAGNVIGGGDWSRDRLIPDYVRAKRDGEHMTLRYPHAVRPWQFVLDPLRGYQMLIEALWEDGESFSGGWNFGPEVAQSWSVDSVVACLHKLWPGVCCKYDNGSPMAEASALFLNSRKAYNKLGWQAKLDTKALEWTVEWYRCHSSTRDKRVLSQLSIQQIDRFSELPLEELLQ